MMSEGKIIFDCEGEEKSKLKIEDLIAKFSQTEASLEPDTLF